MHTPVFTLTFGRGCRNIHTNRMTMPLVSICIGAYNRKNYIRECVDSTLAQTWPNKEVIVVDDASTDGTREILQSYGDSIRLILRDTNSGICPISVIRQLRRHAGNMWPFWIQMMFGIPKK